MLQGNLSPLVAPRELSIMEAVLLGKEPQLEYFDSPPPEMRPEVQTGVLPSSLKPLTLLQCQGIDELAELLDQQTLQLIADERFDRLRQVA